MVGSGQFTVTSATAVLVAAAPGSVSASQIGWAFVSNGSGGKIWLGGLGVTSANGAGLAASTTLSIPLFGGDQVYAIADSASSTVGVLATGV